MNVPNRELAPGRRAAKRRATQNPARLLAAHAVDAILDKKGHDITVMDMRKVSGVADYFVLCTGDSELQIRAIAESVQDRIRERCEEKPWHTEGNDHYKWVLIDYVDLVVHVFSVEKRAFYSLERLWGDAPVEQVPDEGSSADAKLLAPEAPDAAPAPRASEG
jgi:ribosome-associated protein